MVNKLIFTINSSYDGLATYEVYNGLDCGLTGATVTYSGTTQIVNGTSNVIVDNVDVVENLSVKVIDSNNCEICQNQTIVIPEQPVPPVEESEIEVEFIVTAFNEEFQSGGTNNANGYLTLNYQTLISSGTTVTNGVLANEGTPDSTLLDSVMVKAETDVTIIASNTTPTFDDNVKTIIQVFAFYPTGNIPPQAVLIDNEYIKTVGSPQDTTLVFNASDGFGAKKIVKYRVYVTFISYYVAGGGQQ